MFDMQNSSDIQEVDHFLRGWCFLVYQGCSPTDVIIFEDLFREVVNPRCPSTFKSYFGTRVDNDTEASCFVLLNFGKKMDWTLCHAKRVFQLDGLWGRTVQIQVPRDDQSLLDFVERSCILLEDCGTSFGRSRPVPASRECF